MAVASDLDEAHIHYLVVIERVTSGLSVAGCLFVIITFLISKSFHRPINRLVFFASVGNLFTNIATVTAVAVLDRESSFLCQAQGFLIQMFMAADVLWTLAMACNVYLTFYHKFGVARLKKMEKWYFLLCYGLPFVPAFVYIWAQSPGKGRIYGDALLWCWITPEYDYLRVATFYGPIWLVILTTFGIYIRAGREIYNKRKQLRQFASSDIAPDMIPANPFDQGAIHERTDVAISYETTTADHPTIDVNALGRQLSAADRRHSGGKGQPQYTVAVSAVPAVYKIGSMPPFPSVPKRPKKTKEEKERGEDPSIKRYQTIEANRAAWGYTKVAVLFFSAMLITWIPSSANRLYGVAHPGQISIPLTYAAAFVLPLQGFWNCLIYMITSLHACKELLGWMGVKRYSDGSMRHGGHERRNTFGMTNIDMGKGTRIPSMAGDKDISETESTIELASQR